MKIDLDQDEFRKAYVTLKGQSPQVKLAAHPIKCPKCVNSIESLENQFPDLESVRVNFSESTIDLALTTSDKSFTPVIQKLEEMGYELKAISPETPEEQAQNQSFKKDLLKVAIALFCTGNIMMVSFPVYFGATTGFKELFSWIALVLFLPLFFYSSWDMQKLALKQLLSKKVSVDLPIVFAIWIGFLLSIYNTIIGNENIYFDSLAMILALILTSRFVLEKILKAQKVDSQYSALLGEQPVLLVEEKRSIPSSQLKPGQVYSIRIGDTVPADSLLVSDHGEFGLEFLTGESEPMFFSKNKEIKAGSKLYSSEALLKSTTTLNNSYLFEQIEKASHLKKADLQSLYDKISFYFVGVIGALSFATLAFWIYQGNITEAINRTIAISLLACPCALAIGGPLVFRNAVQSLLKKSIILLNPNAIEKMNHIDTILFDKTGTLTTGEQKISHLIGNYPSQEEINVIYALESKSYHPVAHAIQRYFQAQTSKEVELEDWQEIPGAGVQAQYKGHFYEIKQSQNSFRPSFFKDGYQLFEMQVEETKRKDIHKVLNYFKKQNFKIKVLTGDSQVNSERFLEEIETPLEVYSQLSPEEKLNVDSDRSLFIGDGLNDTFLFNKSFLSGKVRSGVNNIKQNVDFIYCQSGLNGLIEMHSLCKNAKSVLNRNLAFSLTYNIIGVTLAAMGIITPLIAAIAMPVSSVIIILSSMTLLKNETKPVKSFELKQNKLGRYST